MSYLMPVLGGLLIGVSVALLLWGLGRVAGISGIYWQALGSAAQFFEERLWRLLFISGLIAGPFVLLQLDIHSAPETSSRSWPIIVLAGLLVGIGTRLGSGCTSGHGVCGIARLSARSIVATGVFMGTAILVVALFKQMREAGL